MYITENHIIRIGKIMAQFNGFISAEEERCNATLYQSNLTLSFRLDTVKANLHSTLYSWGISVRPKQEIYRHVASPFTRFWLFENAGGEIFFEDSGKTVIMVPGQRYIVSPGHPFVVTYYPGSTLYYAHFSAVDWTGRRVFRRAPALYEAEKIHDEFLLKETWRERCPGSALLLLLHMVSRYLTRDWENLKEEYHFCSKFNAVFEYVINTPPALHRVGAMADVSNMTQAAFSRNFHEIMGITPKEYLQQYYLEQASDLLCGTDDTLSDIARKLGHTDIPNFFHSFKRLTGVTPAVYREKK